MTKTLGIFQRKKREHDKLILGRIGRRERKNLTPELARLVQAKNY